MRSSEPMFNVPRSVVVVMLLLVGVHVLRSLLPEEQDAWLTLALAFIPARYSGDVTGIPGGPVASVTSFVTHMVVHGDLTHLMINTAWLLAFGGAVAERVGGLRFLLFSMLCGVAGAAFFLVFNPGLAAPMVGASGAVSGLMAGTLRFLFPALDGGGLWLLRHAPRSVRLMSLAETLSDRRAIIAIVVWLALNALASLGVGTMGETGGIAWEAHIGGFAAGLVGFGLFDRFGPGKSGRDDFAGK